MCPIDYRTQKAFMFFFFSIFNCCSTSRHCPLVKHTPTLWLCSFNHWIFFFTVTVICTPTYVHIKQVLVMFNINKKRTPNHLFVCVCKWEKKGIEDLLSWSRYLIWYMYEIILYHNWKNRWHWNSQLKWNR